MSLQKIFVKHYKSGRTTYQIAEQYATTHETVRNHLMAHGVVMRPKLALSPAKKRARRLASV
jgi:predicted transcriptional regulator